MKAYLALLSILIILSTALYPATAASFSIFAYDKESNAPLQDAYVTISQGGSLVDSGITDASGFFPANLIDGSVYRIRAEYSGKWDEITDYVANSASSNQIKLYLHP
jgi:hypothetical protein